VVWAATGQVGGVCCVVVAGVQAFWSLGPGIGLVVAGACSRHGRHRSVLVVVASVGLELLGGQGVGWWLFCLGFTSLAVWWGVLSLCVGGGGVLVSLEPFGEWVAVGGGWWCHVGDVGGI
jgi:hypothetical protein